MLRQFCWPPHASVYPSGKQGNLRGGEAEEVRQILASVVATWGPWPVLRSLFLPPLPCPCSGSSPLPGPSLSLPTDHLPRHIHPLHLDLFLATSRELVFLPLETYCQLPLPAGHNLNPTCRRPHLSPAPRAHCPDPRRPPRMLGSRVTLTCLGIICAEASVWLLASVGKCCVMSKRHFPLSVTE